MLNFNKPNIMKNTFRTIAIIILLVISPIFSIHCFSEGPARPGGNPYGSGGPIGGNAPVDGGLSIFLILGAAYSLKKTFSVKKEE
jgi:hypothetical protein